MTIAACFDVIYKLDNQSLADWQKRNLAIKEIKNKFPGISDADTNFLIEASVQMLKKIFYKLISSEINEKFIKDFIKNNEISR